MFKVAHKQVACRLTLEYNFSGFISQAKNLARRENAQLYFNKPGEGSSFCVKGSCIDLKLTVLDNTGAHALCADGK